MRNLILIILIFGLVINTKSYSQEKIETECNCYIMLSAGGGYVNGKKVPTESVLIEPFKIPCYATKDKVHGKLKGFFPTSANLEVQAFNHIFNLKKDLVKKWVQNKTKYNYVGLTVFNYNPQYSENELKEKSNFFIEMEKGFYGEIIKIPSPKIDLNKYGSTEVQQLYKKMKDYLKRRVADY